MIKAPPPPPDFRIDFHTHILPSPDKFPNWTEKFGYDGFISLDTEPSYIENGITKILTPGNARMMKGPKFFREVEPNTWDVNVRLKDMERDGIDVQVLCTVPVMFAYWAKPADCAELARFLNDDIARICHEHPNNFIGLGTVPMQDPSLAIIEMNRCLQELHLVGIQIGSHVNELNLDASEFELFWEAAEKSNCLVLIHPWDMPSGQRNEKHWISWLAGMPYETTCAAIALMLGGVLERHPKLRIILAHGAGSLPYILGRIEHGYNCRPDLCATASSKSPKEYIGNIWCDSITHDPDALRFLVQKMGADRVVFGTDYPFPLGEVTGSAPGISPGHTIDSIPIDDSVITEEVRQKIFGQNAVDLL